MHSFKDSAGREWKLKLDFASAEEIEDSCKIDLTVQADLEKLLGHRRTFLEAVSILVREQVVAHGVTAETLKASFDAEVWQSAADALEEEIVFFTRNGQLNRRMIPALRKRRDAMAAALTERIETGQLDQRIAAATDSASGATGSPASSESTIPS